MKKRCVVKFEEHGKKYLFIQNQTFYGFYFWDPSKIYAGGCADFRRVLLRLTPKKFYNQGDHRLPRFVHAKKKNT